MNFSLKLNYLTTLNSLFDSVCKEYTVDGDVEYLKQKKSLNR